MTEQLHFHFSLSCIGEGNGNPLQCSCLGNPRDWAAVYGVAQSRTRLKRLRSSSGLVGFPGSSAGKKPFCSAGDPASMPGLGRFPGGGHGNPLQYSCLETPHGQKSLAGYRPGGCRESDTTERLSTAEQRFGVRLAVVLTLAGK